jgi:hypothetical protein
VRLFSEYDFGWANSRKKDWRARMEPLISQWNVTAITPLTLLTQLHSPLLYLQIDAEGRDDEILAHMPLADPRLRPSVGIMFENVLLDDGRFDATMRILERHGYTRHCQVDQNTLSMRPLASRVL